MLAASLEVRCRQRPDERDAVVPQTHEFHPEALAHAGAVLPLACDRLLIPRGERFAGDHVADPPGEAASLSLDEMPDAFVDAPLPRRRMPLRSLVSERVHLAFDERARRLQERGDLRGGER